MCGLVKKPTQNPKVSSATIRPGVHMDELGIHGFDISEHKELLDAGVDADVAFALRVGIAPLFGGLAEEGDVE